ncbi:MAG TPA: efflux transporter periplasmic adaptor subunit [Erythrobacter sp.]|jgi:membrane fusion protein (multidrug efflux system)|uniref:Efflux RND transporter periplasmic adaptor subunit n=2 Tax=Qipengyuania citrea TaxID=225971 RepID=A0A6I4UBG1_9SPHN|nr:efflux RND transporter periplasmic adaptor subunit [Qipengyuania citrea]MAQ30616.1 efflux transporter periplasmic adaptor subunit [Erythrobacter sp.]MBL4791359.1 efflux RND transporter periplasmic adaptor subunit [Citromicrobium sp.]MCZ4264593.1 efflux RND transporter periplasmic adaptor subunit [Erythrobacter sp. G21629-S1]MDQ0566158.1 membrane fusion protein (multidrug efflux system) [Qipengyuania citrea]MXP34519.1 efflux RND transporter periplasmic adaptor subunit [Qipengyuania citrea]|tara:strand:- start:101 stop:1264 length:1164 start_codon:yes stop_codon:yes gene_type:complete
MTHLRTLLLFVLGLAAAACSSPDQSPQGQAIPVRTITVAQADIDNVLELPGRVEPVRVAEVRARVTGIVQQRLYEEGTDVGQGQPLFRIDPAELRASYAQTQASLERAKATAANANAVVQRYRPLVEENAISGQEFDAAQAAAREANANVAQIQAQLKSASLQLGYTTVRAPIAGRAGRAAVTEGALVSQPEGTLMTRIEQVSPIYVSFSQSATEVLQIRRAIAAGELALSADDAVEVRLVFPDGTEYEIPGLIEFLDFTVDEATGTIELRAEFPNPDGLLLSGEFVNARIYAGKATDVIAIPQAAVTVADSGGTVMIVDKDGKAALRPIKLGRLVGDKWVVESGLQPGDRVIVSNLQKLQPGMPVQIANTPNGRAAAPAAPAAKAD